MQPKPETIILSENGKVPNSDLPVIIYRAAVHGDNLADIFRRAFHAHDWRGVWENGIYDYHHFHSNAHEVLGVAEGTATVMLGGENGTVLDLTKGDVLILPAGTGHKRMRCSQNFLVVGAYPSGQEDYDICTEATAPVIDRVQLREVALPRKDPLHGSTGSLVALWQIS